MKKVFFLFIFQGNAFGVIFCRESDENKNAIHRCTNRGWDVSYYYLLTCVKNSKSKIWKNSDETLACDIGKFTKIQKKTSTLTTNLLVFDVKPFILLNTLVGIYYSDWMHKFINSELSARKLNKTTLSCSVFAGSERLIWKTINRSQMCQFNFHLLNL